MGAACGGEGKGRGGDAGLISAAEIGCFAYCPEQFRLQYGLGLKAENREAPGAGTRHHERKAVAERIAGGFISIGRLVAVLAILVLLLLWGLSR